MTAVRTTVAGRARDAVAATGASARVVWDEPGLRRVTLALLGSAVGDGAYATALAVYTFRWGGPAALGAYLALKLVLKAVAVPFLVAMAAQLRHRTVLVGLDATRGLLVAGVALVVLTGGPAPLVLVLAALTGLVGAPFRPVSAALVCSLAPTPRALTAANGLGSTVESTALFLGPALGGALLAVSSVPVVFAVDVASFAWSAALLLGLPAGTARRARRTAGDVDDRPRPRPAHDAVAGFRTVLGDRRLRLVVALGCLQSVVVGASAVFTVVVAVRLAGLGEAGVGWLTALLGAGAVVGGLVALGRAGGGTPASDVGLGLLAWTLPLTAVGLTGDPVVALVAFLVIGVGGPLVDVGVLTLVQRLSPRPALHGALAALESATFAALALGALAMPVLLAALGPGVGLVALAAPVVAVTLVGRRALRRLDAGLRPPATLALVTAQPLFAALPPAAQELLASRLRRLDVQAGTRVVEAGEPGEDFYLVASGRLEAVRGDLRLSEMAAGDCFGEIALLRDVPRTATVVARTDAVLQVLGRADFLEAVGADPETAARADRLVGARLAR